MQIEVLKFLLDAQSHLRDGIRSSHDERALDLQAVERELPDCDWFELEASRERSYDAVDFWNERRQALEF